MTMTCDTTAKLADRTLGPIVRAALAEGHLPERAEVTGAAGVDDIAAWDALLDDLTRNSWADAPLRARWLAEQMRRNGAIRIVRH